MTLGGMTFRARSRYNLKSGRNSKDSCLILAAVASCPLCPLFLQNVIDNHPSKFAEQSRSSQQAKLSPKPKLPASSVSTEPLSIAQYTLQKGRRLLIVKPAAISPLAA
jgi:hypothetical protein